MTDTPAERGVENLWARLRRRKVVQWGVVYVAAAWGFLQGLEYISESFNWPQQARQVAVLALVIGLPIVLVLAWYHGDRGQQRVTTPEFAILTLLLLIGGGAFWYYQHASEVGKDATPTASAVQQVQSPGTTDARPSVAVLPFENRSREADDAFFVDGIHDDVLTQLSKVSALRVISRTSVERFRKTALSVPQIAQQLGVRSILEGGVQRAGQNVRVNVQLIDAGNDAHIWAESYDRDLTAANIFAIQSEIATAIAGALKATLKPAEEAGTNSVPTQSLEAWEAYQLGRQRMATRTSADLTSAQRFFRKAIDLDPTFALAYAGLADTLCLQIAYSGAPTESTLDEAEKAVSQALKLELNLAEAWASSGLIAQYRLQDERAESMFRRAIEANPNYAPAHQWLSSTLAAVGRRQEALLAAERAAALDPLSGIINAQLGNRRASIGSFEDARTAYERAIEIDPRFANAYKTMGNLEGYGFGRLDKAVVWYEKAVILDPGSGDAMAALAEAYWELGDQSEAGRWLSRALALGEGSAYTNSFAARLYLDRGEAKLARKHAQIAAELDLFFLSLMRDHDLRAGDYATARTRYAKTFPQLFKKPLPTFNDYEAVAAVELALVLQHTGEEKQAKALLDRTESYIQTRAIPRMGVQGYMYTDVRIHALRGDRAKALASLREAEKAGCRVYWPYYRDFDPALASIRNTPEFKAVFADIARDMAQQRARLAARPKDAPLDLAATGT